MKIWDNFSDITKKLHSKRKIFEKDKKKELKKNTQIKNKISNKITELADTKIRNYKEMVQKIKKLEELINEWKKTGPTTKEENEKTWKKHLKSIRYFKNKKNEFYKSFKKKIKDIIKEKETLCKKAESLENSLEWKESTDQIKHLQEKWKTLGYLGNKEGNKIWERFQKACNIFFTNKKAFFNSLEKKFIDNLDKKNQEIEKLKLFKPTKNKLNDINKIKKFIDNWKLLGRVPKSESSKIQSEFNKEINKHFKNLNITEEERDEMFFKSSIEALIKNGDEKQINKEKEILKKRLKYTQNEIEQLKANIGLFSKSKSTQSLVKQVEKKIQLNSKKIENFRKQLSIISNL